jgi:hypothetical protein
MTFDKDYLSRISTTGSERAAIWRSYVSAADTLATIIASGYFNDKILDWAVGDIIHVQGTDDYGLYKVTSVTTNVTLEAYQISESDLDLTYGSIFIGDASGKASELVGKTDTQILVGNGTTMTSVALSSDVTMTNAGVVTIANDAITTVKILDSNVTEAKIAPNTLTGTVAANVADLNVIGGLPILFRVDTAGGASSTTHVVMTHKIRVIDCWVVNNGTGTASDTIKLVNNGVNDITNAIDISGADKTVARVGTIDDAEAEVAATNELDIVETDGGGSDSPATTVYVLAVRVA